MDLNSLPAPQPKPLRVLRLGKAEPAFSQDLPEPPVGEALPESQGFDVGHAISPEEREALHEAGYDDADIDAIVAEYDAPNSEAEFSAADEQDWRDQQDLPVHTGLDAMRRASEDLRRVAEENFAKAEAYAEQHFYTRYCPLPQCDVGVRVAKGEDQGDVLGIGMSMRAAVELEQLLTSHLEEHSLGEWMAALKELQDQLDRPVAVGLVDKGFQMPQPGIVHGAKNRSPERQAAVDAMDRRLGAQVAPMPPQQAAERDSQLREARRRRRERQPTPYDLTPSYSADPSFSGQVGIKR